MDTIGQQIKRYRVEMGYTQEKLGQLIGVTSQAVSKWERGSVPDAELIPLIAQSLGISIDNLYGNEEQNLSPLSCAGRFRSACLASRRRLSCLLTEALPKATSQATISQSLYTTAA